MEVLRFGTLPIVRSTGGLKDTITQLNIEKNTGNGVVFSIADKAGLDYGIQEALKFYKIPINARIKHMKRVMTTSKRQFNLHNTAEKYLEIYDKLIKEKREGS